MSTNGTTTGSGLVWTGPRNGDVCPGCAARYIGSHACSREDILRRIGELSRLLDAMPPTPRRVADPTSGCPCRPENGGSGVCGCVLSGPRITCQA